MEVLRADNQIALVLPLTSYQSTSGDTSEPVELAYTPTWSAHLSFSANNTMI